MSICCGNAPKVTVGMRNLPTFILAVGARTVHRHWLKESAGHTLNSFSEGLFQE
jgi:hypothetical protein